MGVPAGHTGGPDGIPGTQLCDDPTLAVAKERALSSLFLFLSLSLFASLNACQINDLSIDSID